MNRTENYFNTVMTFFQWSVSKIYHVKHVKQHWINRFHQNVIHEVSFKFFL
jgi:hypothetical protein